MKIPARTIRGKSLYRLMTISCATAFAMYGYDAGVLGGVQGTEPFLSAMGHPTGKWVIPMIASSYTLAATVCSFSIAFIGLGLGRRRSILIGDLFVIIGAAVQASAFGVGQMIAGRVLCGFGVGFISAAVPTYMAEMSITENQRGPAVAIQCCLLICGVPLAYWIDFGMIQVNNQATWRVPIALQAVFASISGGIMIFLPDTPRWYFARNMVEKGLRVISDLHDEPIDSPNVMKMRRNIEQSIELEEREDGQTFNPLWVLWDRSAIKAGKRLRISFLILALQQMMGINLSVYYSTTILRSVGVSERLSQILAAVMNMGFATGTFFTIWTIERFGRRKILIGSACVLTLCLLVFVVLQGVPNPSTGRQWGSVAMLIVYNFFFGYGWIGPAWLYGPEIAPLRLRHAAGSMAATGEWLFAFITVFAGGIALQNVGWKTWLWMLLSCATAVPFVYFLCPETTGKTLEEIDTLFTDEADTLAVVEPVFDKSGVTSERWEELGV